MGPIRQRLWGGYLAVMSANHAATSASDAGDHGDGGTSPEFLGMALQPAAGRAEGTKREPVLPRI